jgi:hypothetical protein
MRFLPGGKFQRACCRALVFAILLPAARGQEVDDWDPSIPVRVGARVVVSTNESSIGPGAKVRPEVVQQMVDEVLQKLTGRRTARQAWQSLLGPQEVVGIKVAASGSSVSGVRLATILAVVRGLRDAGFSREQIVVWDRRLDDLRSLGLVENSRDYVLDWTEGGSGYDSERPVTAPLLGKLIWGDSQFKNRAGLAFSELSGVAGSVSSQSFPARILTRRVTKVINLASLQDSYLTGVHGTLAALVLGSLDNWRRLGGPPHFGDPYLAEIYGEDFFVGKVVLHLVDGLFLQYAGGPFPEPKFTLEHFSIFASYDPVALDVLARDTISEIRVGQRLPSLDKMTDYLRTAALLGWGIEDRSKIQLESVRE